MARGLTQVKADIRQIDRNIDGIRKELVCRVGRFNTLSAHDWQLAWDKHPDLRVAETALYFNRGQLQQERNLLEDQARRAQLRRDQNAARKAAKSKICTSCGQALAA